MVVLECWLAVTTNEANAAMLVSSIVTLIFIYGTTYAMCTIEGGRERERRRARRPDVPAAGRDG